MADKVRKCHLDIETYSEADLKRGGTFKYAQHESTEIICVSWSFDNGPVHLWIPYDLPNEIIDALEDSDRFDGVLYVGAWCQPEDLFEFIKNGGQVRAHNAEFERTVLNATAGEEIGFPKLSIVQMVCTAAKAAAHSLPRALEKVAQVLGTYPKDQYGKNDMLALCKPRRGKTKRYSLKEHGDKFVNCFLYCCDDVRAERDIDHKVPDLPPREQRVWEMDQRINDRGWRIDTTAIDDVQFLVGEYKSILSNKVQEMTAHEITRVDGQGEIITETICFRPSQVAKLSEWIRSQYDIENLQAATVKEALTDPDCPPLIKRILRAYSLYNMKAVTKYIAMLRAMATDGRLHGMFLYHGASTGRWSSMKINLQNLFRPLIKDCDTAIEAYSLRELRWIAALFEHNPMKIFASTVRGMLIPESGKDLIVYDFTSIEAYVNPWMWDQKDVLEVIESGADLYKYVAAKIYRKRIEDVTDDERFIGKIAVLALGYQGGKRAFAKMAKQYGVQIEEELADTIKEDWRLANPKIVAGWYDIEEAACTAVSNPGVAYACADEKIMFKVVGDFLYMRLPSGRRLAYYKPQLDIEGKLTYLGIDTYTRQWCRCKTYGGKLTENAVQAIARDLLVFALFNLEKAGYFVIGHVHDEIVIEIPEGEGDMKEVRRIICLKPKWIGDMPLRATGYRAKRYRK